MTTVKKHLYLFPECENEAKNGTSTKTTPDRLRYRCAHTAWLKSSQVRGNKFQQSLHRAVRCLEQMQVCRDRVAALHVQANLATVYDSRRAGLLLTQLQTQVLLALGAMKWLWQHSPWQLLAQPRNHIARTCQKVIYDITGIFNSRFCKGSNLPASRSHLQVVKGALSGLRLEKQRWMHLQACSAQWSAMAPKEISHALTRLRHQFGTSSETACVVHSNDLTLSRRPDHLVVRARRHEATDLTSIGKSDQKVVPNLVHTHDQEFP